MIPLFRHRTSSQVVDSKNLFVSCPSRPPCFTDELSKYPDGECCVQPDANQPSDHSIKKGNALFLGVIHACFVIISIVECKITTSRTCLGVLELIGFFSKYCFTLYITNLKCLKTFCIITLQLYYTERATVCFSQGKLLHNQGTTCLGLVLGTVICIGLQTGPNICRKQTK